MALLPTKRITSFLVLLSMCFANKISMIINENGISLGAKSSATDRLNTDDVIIYIRHNQKNARDLRQALVFARYVDNNS